MPDLVIRPSGQPAPREWILQLRWHDSIGPTLYQTLCRMDRETAEEVIDAGPAEWLFGPPKDEAVERSEALAALAKADADLL